MHVRARKIRGIEICLYIYIHIYIYVLYMYTHIEQWGRYTEPFQGSVFWIILGGV